MNVGHRFRAVIVVGSTDMLRQTVFALSVVASVGSASASTFVDGNKSFTISFSSILPTSSYAPTDVIDSSGLVLKTTPSEQYIPGSTYLGLTQSFPNIARSPFEGTSTPSKSYDAVTWSGKGVSSATFGTRPSIEIADVRRLDAAASSTFGTGSGSFSFIYGSPDSYNTLQFLDAGGNVIASFTGDQLTDPNRPTGLGYQVTTISASDFRYDAVRFETTQNSFEFAAISSVPLPASAPMFGAALVALGVFGYRLKRAKIAG